MQIVTKKFEDLSQKEFMTIAKHLGFDDDANWSKILWDNFNDRNRRAATSTIRMMGYKKADVTDPNWVVPIK